MTTNYSEIFRAVRAAVEAVDPWGKLVGNDRDPDVYAEVVAFLADRLAGGEILYPALVQAAFAPGGDTDELDEDDIREIARRIGSELGFGG